MMRRLLLGTLTVLAGLYLLCAVIYAIPVIAGVLDDMMEVHFDQENALAGDGNGLSAQEKETYYHLSQGAEILPWILFTAVEVADPNSTKPFAENLARYGLLPDHMRADGLPVGLTRASNASTFGMEFVGITCAACHVSELNYQGKTVRVDGAPNMFNLQLFYSEAIDGLLASVSDTGKLWRTLKRLGRQDFARYSIAAPFVRPVTLVYYGTEALLHRDEASARLELVDVIRTAKERRDPAHPTSGFGRLDAFDGTRNFLLTRLRKSGSGSFNVNLSNMVKLDAPVKFPFLWSLKANAPSTDQSPAPYAWGFKDYDWFEWTINTNTVMERNISETLGAGATVVLDPDAKNSLFDNSIPIRNLHALELLSYKLDPPRWPQAFGAINTELAAKGQALFQSNCANCHEYGVEQRTATGLIKLRGFSPDVTGTDTTAALRISCPVSDIGFLNTPRKSFTMQQSEFLGACNGVKAGAPFDSYRFSAVVQAVVDSIKHNAYAAAGVTLGEQQQMEDVARRQAVNWRDTLLDSNAPYGPYAARPLYGIWAAAPYLHNGSVPTLYDLLLPPDQRPKQFALGNRTYDPAKLGFVVETDCNRQDCLVDTTLVGSGAGGHLWGTELAEPDRLALLEYLKTY